MKLPEGRLVRSRVVEQPRTVLVDALDRRLTGYVVFEPRETLLLDEEGDGILTFEEGVPRLAYHTGTERGGPAALADLAASGPYRLELVAAESDALDVDSADLRVPPEMAAERLAGDQALAERTRSVAPATATGSADSDASADRTDATAKEDDTDDDRPGAVEAFLDDAEKIERIREAAREEATERAAEWGFDSL
jgi:hypothetical protein